MKIKSLFLTAALPLTLTLAACSGGSNPDVSARQDVMKDWKDAMGVMGGMAEAPDTFDLAKFQENAQFLAESANKPWAHFNDQNELGGATEAVWINADEFKAEAENFQQVTAELNAAAQSATTLDEILPALKPVGDGCQSCHEDFKKPND